MGELDHGRQRQAESNGVYRPLVAFDFDGTLTSKDSFTAFMAWRAGPLVWASGLASLAPAAARYVIDRDRGRLKAEAARVFLAGLTAPELEAEAQAFATERGRSLMRPDALRAWRRWPDRPRAGGRPLDRHAPGGRRGRAHHRAARRRELPRAGEGAAAEGGVRRGRAAGGGLW
jgi:hypothetical protein